MKTLKNLVPKKGSLRTMAGKPWFYAGRTSWGSKAQGICEELKSRGIECRTTFDKYLGHFIWTSRPIKVDLAETRMAVNPNLKLAKEMKSRYTDDLKAGHKSAAEYWRGQAAAYFTSNPALCHVCHRPFTKCLRRPIRAMSDKNPVLVCGVCARRIVKKNPLGAIMTTIGESAIAGVGLGIGFGAVDHVKKKLVKK